VHARELVAASSHRAMRYIGALRDVAAFLSEQVAAGDVVITLGAGDGCKIGEWLLESLKAKG
jgi:UDP-N-acetylmuramate--alanine ligase